MMAVTMKNIRAALDPEEPDYQEAAKLGAPALPHLEALVTSDDAMLASKATYLASLIKNKKSAAIVERAAHSDVPAVRVAAAAAASNLAAPEADTVLVALVGDPDPGVRKVARRTAGNKPSPRLAEKLAALNTGAEYEGGGDTPTESGPVVTGLMPGEADPETGVGATMPGENPGAMPGEQGKMPGE
jgi:hypothetical protein